MTPLLTEAEREARQYALTPHSSDNASREPGGLAFTNAFVLHLRKNSRILVAALDRLLSARAVPMPLKRFDYTLMNPNDNCEEHFYEMLLNPEGKWVKFSAAEAYTAGMREREARLVEVLDALADHVDTETPEANCSCHLNPPCSDCFDYGHARELVAEARALTDTTTKEEGGEDADRN